MRRRGHALRRRYGRARARLKWQRMPGQHGQSFTQTREGRIYTATLDTRKRKWVLTDDHGFVGSAIRKRDAQKIAEQREASR